MSTVSSAGGGGSSALSGMKSQRSQMQAKVFAKVDGNGDGGIDKAELQSMVSKISAKTGTSAASSSAGANLDKVFSQLDSNTDGKIDSVEMGKGMKNLAQAMAPNTMAFAQSRGASMPGNATSNGAGRVQGPQDLDPANSKDLFAKVDTNGDGSIDAAESQVLSEKIKADTGKDTSDMFAKLDKDGDGKLSKAEFEAGKPPRGAGGPGGAQGSGGPQGPQGAGGPPPGGALGGRGGPGGAQGKQSASSTSFDPLDTNQDGVVSEAERLVAQIQSVASSNLSEGAGSSSSSGSQNASTGKASNPANAQAQASRGQDAAGAKLAQFVQQLYQQIATNSTSNSNASSSRLRVSA